MIRNNDVLFTVSEDLTTLTLALTPEAVASLQGGKAQTLDITKYGFPLRVILFCGTSQEDVLKRLGVGPDTLDLRGLDLGFGPESEN